MGGMPVKFLIQRIDFGWPEANRSLDEFPFDSPSIDLVRCVRHFPLPILMRISPRLLSRIVPS
jgi:hypothetical protein